MWGRSACVVSKGACVFLASNRRAARQGPRHTKEAAQTGTQEIQNWVGLGTGHQISICCSRCGRSASWVGWPAIKDAYRGACVTNMSGLGLGERLWIRLLQRPLHIRHAPPVLVGLAKPRVPLAGRQQALHGCSVVSQPQQRLHLWSSRREEGGRLAAAAQHRSAARQAQAGSWAGQPGRPAGGGASVEPDLADGRRREVRRGALGGCVGILQRPLCVPQLQPHPAAVGQQQVAPRWRLHGSAPQRLGWGCCRQHELRRAAAPRRDLCSCCCPLGSGGAPARALPARAPHPCPPTCSSMPRVYSCAARCRSPPLAAALPASRSSVAFSSAASTCGTNKSLRAANHWAAAQPGWGPRHPPFFPTFSPKAHTHQPAHTTTTPAAGTHRAAGRPCAAACRRGAAAAAGCRPAG